MKYWVIVLFILLGCEKKESDKSLTQNLLEGEKIATVELHYEAPATWISEETVTSMRKAQFKIPGKTDEDAGEMAVFHFPNMDIDPQENLNRWIRQFKSTDGSDITKSIEKQDFDIKDMKIHYIKLDGIYKKSSNPFLPNAEITELKNYTMLAAIVNTKNGPWFFKAVGPNETMGMAKTDFETMLLTVK